MRKRANQHMLVVRTLLFSDLSAKNLVGKTFNCTHELRYLVIAVIVSAFSEIVLREVFNIIQHYFSSMFWEVP